MWDSRLTWHDETVGQDMTWHDAVIYHLLSKCQARLLQKVSQHGWFALIYIMSPQWSTLIKRWHICALSVNDIAPRKLMSRKMLCRRTMSPSAPHDLKRCQSMVGLPYIHNVTTLKHTNQKMTYLYIKCQQYCNKEQYWQWAERHGVDVPYHPVHHMTSKGVTVWLMGPLYVYASNEDGCCIIWSKVMTMVQL